MKPALSVDLRHGPARRPVRLGYGLAEARLGAAFPYFGIVSRGLEHELPRGPEGSRSWARIAPVLEDVLHRRSRLPIRGVSVAKLVEEAEAALSDLDGATPERRIADRELAHRLVVAAMQGEMLSYVQSAQAAASFLERLVRGELDGWARVAELFGVGPGAEPDRCELWSVREGSTSSVWRVTLDAASWRRPILLALNVARDREAGRELVESSMLQERAHGIDRDGIVPVLAGGDAEVVLAGDRTLAVPVVATPWLEGALELHVIGASIQSEASSQLESARFFAVDGFEIEPAGPGLRATGRLLDEASSDRMWGEHVARCTRTMELTGAGAAVPEFELNDGDLVLWESRTVAVGLSRPRPEVTLSAALLPLLVPSARADGALATGTRLYWNKPTAALEVMTRTWLSCGRDPAALEAALAETVSAIERTASDDADEPRAMALELAREALQRRALAA